MREIIKNNFGRLLQFGLYLHEFGHALGMVHEHQLPNRDDFLDVLWNQVNPDMRQWFKKYTAAELRRYGVPYDLSSVMHYELNVRGWRTLFKDNLPKMRKYFNDY